MLSKAKNIRKTAAKSAKGITVRFPPSMWKLLNDVGSKLYTPARAGKRQPNPKYAQTVCMILSDNDRKKADQLLKLMVVAYRDFAKLSGDAVKFAP